MSEVISGLRIRLILRMQYLEVDKANAAKFDEDTMSSRTYMLSLESLEPIRNAIASADQGLLDGLIGQLDDEYPELAEYAHAMIMGPRRTEEPGCWNYLIEPLARQLGLRVERLPLEEWKHFKAWPLYRSLVDAGLTANSRSMLKSLQIGRPFLGTSIEEDGCTFAWLSNSEVSQLLQELLPLDPEDMGELEDFHHELVDSLQSAVTDKMDVFLGAC